MSKDIINNNLKETWTLNLEHSELRQHNPRILILPNSLLAYLVQTLKYVKNCRIQMNHLDFTSFNLIKNLLYHL